MRAIVLGLCLSASLAAQPFRSGVSAAGQSFSVAYTNLTVADTQIEGEIHAFTPAVGSDRAIFNDGLSQCKIVANSLTMQCWNSNDGTPNGLAQVDLSPYSHFRFRFRRDTAHAVHTVEVWDGRGLNYAASTKTVMIGASPTRSATVTIGAGPMDVACIRWSSTLAAINSQPPPAAPASPADQMDFLFENSLADRSAHGWTMTYSGGAAAYTDTPSFDPISRFGLYLSARVFRTGENLNLDGSASFASRVASGVPSNFAWTRTSGPGSYTFGTPGGSTTTFTSASAGTHLIRLTVGDGTASVYTEVQMGAVNTDSNYIVQTGNAAMDKLLGPLLMWGKSPWPYYDLASMADADQIPPVMLRSENVVDAGTAITGGPFTLTATNPPHLTSASSWTNQVTAGQYIIVAWNTIDGAGTGRYYAAVHTINSATDVTLVDYYAPPVLRAKISAPASVTLYQPKTQGGTCDSTSDVCFFYSMWGQTAQAGNANWNYYDRILALYRLYYRTQIDTYLSYARQIADLWWQWGTDHGSYCAANRTCAFGGLFASGLDNHPERIPELKSMILAMANQSNAGSDISRLDTDKRELGYGTGLTALGALLDPANRSTYCTDANSGLVRQVNNWISVQNARGFYAEDIFAGNPSYPQSSPSQSPWRQTIAVKALQYAYDALVDPAVCNNPTLAASLLTSIQSAASWEYDEGYASPNRGIYYVVDNGVVQQNAPQGAGTVSTTQGSDAVVGVTSTFVASGLCDGTHWIAFNPPSGRNYTYVYRVASCADDTHAILASAFTQASLSGVTYWVTTTASTSCGTGSALNCESGVPGHPAPEGDRNLTRFPPGILGWLYAKTGATAYKTKGEELFSAAFGGPASGPGATDACAGPACDGTVTDATAELTSCSRHPIPCRASGSPFVFNAMKNWNEGTGWAAADNYLAYRLGPDRCADLIFAPTTANPGYAGGSGTIAVTVTDQSCAWTANSSAGWLSITSGGSGMGNGSIGWSAAGNTGAERTAAITAAGATFTVAQEAASATSEKVRSGRYSGWTIR